ncbi:hypothetical protein ZIOFF_074670 [Zingiber officinale]|uniref:Uncharacterized protein n=1 Tax=Zingiber officinale TaxID=94328 RepID=A0A8J5C5Q7_ZINOF|nr:hypothetical protein ZIOFF_074670 [Zingiber officinale]
MAAKEQASAAHEAAIALPGNEQALLVWQVHERSHTKRPLLRQATSRYLACGRFECNHVVARHGVSVDQGIAYLLMLVALVLTYLIHPLDASSPYKLF